MPPDPNVPSPTPIPAGDASGGPGRPPKDKRPKREKDLLKGVKSGRFGFDKGQVRAVIERYFRVYEERDALPGLDQAVLVAFYVMAEREELEARYPDLQSDLKEVDPQLMPVLREEGGETIIVVTRRAETRPSVGTNLPFVLFVATLLTLTAAGSIAWMAYDGSIDLARALEPRYIGLGFLHFALPLLFVFGVQEVARRVMARRRGMTAGASYLIPVPPFVFIPSIGTFGSVLHAREPYPDRRVLFDMAAVGPIAGFLAALPVVVLGLLLTTAAAVPVPDGGDIGLRIEAPDGTTWTEDGGGLIDPFERSEPDDPNRAHNVTVRWSVLVAGRGYGTEGWEAVATGVGQTGEPLSATLRYQALGSGSVALQEGSEQGDVAPGEDFRLTFDIPDETERLVVVLEFHVPDRTTLPLGEPLAFMFLNHFLVEEDYVTHPLALAGWTALLVIGVTLVPAGRLDGGGVARALLADRMVILGYLAVGALAVLVFVYPGWLYLVLFIILFLGVRHPAALNETLPLGSKRRVWAFVLLLVLVLSFVPIPARIPGGF